LLAVALWVGALVPSATLAQGKRSPSGIYTCTDERGRKITSDRPIPECMDREQRLLNSDGSTRKVVPPSLTAEERARRDAEARRTARERAAKADAIRRDRNLMVRYPDQASHDRARQAALETVRMASQATELRLQGLAGERVKLDNEAEFYQGRPMPAYLKQQIDANEAAVAAQHAASRNQEAERARISALYDAELERLRRLWAGAEPGSLPALPANDEQADAPPRSARPAAPSRR
jgi:hypothetical protein